MTRDETIRMAREVWSAGDVYIGPSTEPLELFAALVAAAEREACAKVCEEEKALRLAEIIRARRGK